MPNVRFLIRILVPVACAACARDAPRPKIVREVPEPTASAPREVNAPPTSAFTIIARAAAPDGQPDELAAALPRIQRLEGGGLVIAAEYARARSDGAGALAVEVLVGGMEQEELQTRFDEAFRWVWAGPEVAIVTSESALSRGGPTLMTYEVGPNGFGRPRTALGYWSGVKRGRSVLALERTTSREMISDISTSVVSARARIAVLAGSDPAPTLPRDFCARDMSAAPDGSLAVIGEPCGKPEQPSVVRFAPGTQDGKVDSLRPADRTGVHAPVVHAASTEDVWVGVGRELHHWDGRGWTTSVPVPELPVMSLSVSSKRELWAVVADPVPPRTSRLVRHEGDAWRDVPLPEAPRDALEAETWQWDPFSFAFFMNAGEPGWGGVQRDPKKSGPLAPIRVEAAGDEVFVTALEQGELFVLSTKARTPAARIPSPASQRAHIAKTVKRRRVTSAGPCGGRTFLVVDESTTVDAVRAALAKVHDLRVRVGDGFVEGKKRLVVWGPDEAIAVAKKHLAAGGVQQLCGAAVVEKVL